MKIIAFIVLFLSASAFAEVESKVSDHEVSVNASFNTSGLALGAAYDHMLKPGFTFGGHFYHSQKEDDPPNTMDGINVIGARLGYHFYKKNWDLTFTPSFNMIQIDAVGANPGDTSTMGPGLAVSVLTQVTDSVAIGVENARYWVWFDKDYAGVVVDELAFKIRFSID